MANFETKSQSSSRPVIPLLQDPSYASFGRPHSNGLTRDFPVQIANQDGLSGATYNQMAVLANRDLPIKRDEFIRMWKTLILKRVQDVYEKEKMIRAENFIRLGPSTTVPAPLSDLLRSLGRWESKALGVTYDIVPPDPGTPVENWWTVDSDILKRWLLTMSSMKSFYEMENFPDPWDFGGRALVMTTIMEDNEGSQEMRSIGAYTNEPQPEDAYIRLVNDPLFEEAHGVTFANSGYNIGMGKCVCGVRWGYVGGYVIRSKS